jgi:hypothetical protein
VLGSVLVALAGARMALGALPTKVMPRDNLQAVELGHDADLR